ncbi:S8/S53 family peptidase [Anoxybacterium hadale]|uniref:S8/S53 family peptidase n=1 Tax=Anoxybacterium hadale TaxID=3408580 RepID=A0ACD1AFL7_9FIRM|nr:S8/S53 family peptidase [Clostridiales bacterium]
MSAFEQQLEYVKLRHMTGIDRWHDAGYLGQDLKIFCDDVGGKHVEHVVDILEVIVPEAEILTGKIGYRIRYGSVVESFVHYDKTGETIDFDNFMKRHEIRLINNSTTGSGGPAVSPIGAFMRTKIDQYNIIMTASAGNGYGQPINTNYYGAAILVTSVQLNDAGRIVNSKCAEDGGIDFSMFYGPMPGTSYSSPFLLGMIGLLLGKYPRMNQKEVYQYLKEHCISLGIREIFGHGLPILGQV